MVDDKLRILAAIKSAWGKRVTTVFVRQGHYAMDPAIVEAYLEAGTLAPARAPRSREGFTDEDLFVLALLQERSNESDSERTMRGLQQTLRRRKKQAA